jgi:hypothetical protein
VKSTQLSLSDFQKKNSENKEKKKCFSQIQTNEIWLKKKKKKKIYIYIYIYIYCRTMGNKLVFLVISE